MDLLPTEQLTQVDSCLTAPELEEQASDSKLVSSGRWTKSEHQRFVEGLKLFGKDWKRIEDYVSTRNGAQVRSHAQKFFKRLHREFTVDPKPQPKLANILPNKENPPKQNNPEKIFEGALSESTFNSKSQFDFNPLMRGSHYSGHPSLKDINTKQIEQIQASTQSGALEYPLEEKKANETKSNNNFSETVHNSDEQKIAEVLKSLLLQKIASSQKNIIEIHSILKRVKQSYLRNDENFVRSNTFSPADLNQREGFKLPQEDSSKKKRLKELFVKDSAFRVSMDKADAETLQSKLSLLKNSFGNQESVSFKKVKML